MSLPLHIVAGALALLSGFLALYASKGAPLHRRSGMVFFYAMIPMAAIGLIMALVRDKAPAVNVPAAVLTTYLVVTGLTTVRPPASQSRWLLIGGMLLVFSLGLMDFAFGFEAVAAGGKRHGIPAFPFFLFGVVGMLAAGGDLRVLRSGALKGPLRLARHLWRMCFALFIATMSFFIGQAKVIPKPIRIPGLLAIPVLAVLVTMLYWLWRVRVRRSVRGMTVVRTPDGLVGDAA